MVHLEEFMVFKKEEGGKEGNKIQLQSCRDMIITSHPR